VNLRTKRIYDSPTLGDGYRVLVDRLWPRGVSHERAALGAWLKDVAPSPELRTWWNHDPVRLEEFAERYRHELDHNPAVVELEAIVESQPTVTLLYAAQSPRINHAVILMSYLKELAPPG
jgi:uncharacterized protein YeaO (DUF488 family)